MSGIPGCADGLVSGPQARPRAGAIAARVWPENPATDDFSGTKVPIGARKSSRGWILRSSAAPNPRYTPDTVHAPEPADTPRPTDAWQPTDAWEPTDAWQPT